MTIRWSMRRIHSVTWSETGTIHTAGKQPAFPAAEQWQSKFWPAVNRVDNVYGDRNLFCSCPLPDEWQQEDEDSVACR